MNKEIIDRLRNIEGNLANEGNAMPGSNYDSLSASEDISKVTDDLEAAELPGLTKDEYDTINELHAIAERHTIIGDGLDREFGQLIQDAQRILMVRGGSRVWAYIKKNNPKAYGPYNQ